MSSINEGDETIMLMTSMAIDFNNNQMPQYSPLNEIEDSDLELAMSQYRRTAILSRKIELECQRMASLIEHELRRRQ